MDKLIEEAKIALEALDEYCITRTITNPITRYHALRDALRRALSEKHECETCVAKRQRLEEAGLLKSPLRGIAEGPGYEPVVFTNMNSVDLRIGTIRVTGDGITFSDRADAIDTSSTCVDETEKREPVAWWSTLFNVTYIPPENFNVWESNAYKAGQLQPLYTTPPSKPWIDLSVDEIYQAADREDQSYGFVQGALWAEAALMEKNRG